MATATATYLASPPLQYGVCLFLVFILEVSAAIAAFVMQSQVREMLVRTMNEAMINYESDNNVMAAVDFMQTGVSTDRSSSRMNECFIGHSISAGLLRRGQSR